MPIFGKIGDVLKKVPNVLGDVVSGAVEIASGENPIEVVKERIGKKIKQSDELTDAEKELALAELDKELKMQTAYIKDRMSARKMYAKDNSLQKIYALGFGLAYIILTGFMLYIAWQIAVDDVHLSEFAITLVSTLFGAMSAKVNTITDFLFGSSQGSKDKTAELSKLIKQ